MKQKISEAYGIIYDDLKDTKQRLDLKRIKAYNKSLKTKDLNKEILEDFVDDAGGVDENKRGIIDFIQRSRRQWRNIANVGLKDGLGMVR